MRVEVQEEEEELGHRAHSQHGRQVQEEVLHSGEAHEGRQPIGAVTVAVPHHLNAVIAIRGHTTPVESEVCDGRGTSRAHCLLARLR